MPVSTARLLTPHGTASGLSVSLLLAGGRSKQWRLDEEWALRFLIRLPVFCM